MECSSLLLQPRQGQILSAFWMTYASYAADNCFVNSPTLPCPTVTSSIWMTGTMPRELDVMNASSTAGNWSSFNGLYLTSTPLPRAARMTMVRVTPSRMSRWAV